MKGYYLKKGDKFNRLTVTQRTNNKNSSKSWFWLCKCSCGNFTEASTSALMSGRIKSCGCLKLELSKRNSNLENKKFGKLVVIRDSGKRSGSKEKGVILWECLCDCGNKVLVRTYNLKIGKTKSCGCLSKTHGQSGTKQYKAFLASKRRRSIRLATPDWVNMEEIRIIYQNCPEGSDVDHIIPLKGKDRKTNKHIVCGLHVPWNLQYLNSSENNKKYCYAN